MAVLVPVALLPLPIINPSEVRFEPLLSRIIPGHEDIIQYRRAWDVVCVSGWGGGGGAYLD